MINSITTKNFETHLDTTIEFHPGVNTLVGESDEGKSGIVRQIKWNARNRPQGDAYRNDQLDPKKKEDKLKITEVGINYKGSGLVNRARDGFAGGVNHYTIDNQEPLRALRTDVPDEVQEVTKMKDVNIQGQHPSEQYFLLADKPGQVAKEFNKVAGLTIMDKATADINSQVRTCNAEIKIAKKEIDTRQEEIDDTEWVDKAEKLANKLETFRTKINSKQVEYNELNEQIRLIENIEFSLTVFHRVDDAVKTLKELKKEKQVINDIENDIEVIENLISSITEVDLKLNATTDIDKALKSLKSLNLLKENIQEEEKNLGAIELTLINIKRNEDDLIKAERDFEETKKEYDIIREKQECPTCGRKGI